MKCKHQFIAILLVNVCFATSCNNTPNDIPIIDMDNPTGYIDLALSDLLDDITMVPLETRDDLLLSTRDASFIVSNNYILANTEEKLFQFDRQGRFIRIVTTQGNGPNEFNIIGKSLIDETQEIFYYTNLGRSNSIACIHLNTGAFLESLYPDFPPFSMETIDSQGNIYGLPWVADSILLAYKYNPAEQSVTTYKKQRPLITEYIGKVMFRQGDHIFFLSFSYSDTLFKIDGDKTSPQYVMKLKDLQTRDRNRNRSSVNFHFLYSGTHGTIINKMETLILMTERGMSTDNKHTASLFLNKKAELQTIRSMTIFPCIKIPIPTISGLWGHIKVEATDMIELIDQALKGNQLSVDQRKALEEVSAKIDEGSNPILIIGKVK